jgi:hypothetical protein
VKFAGLPEAKMTAVVGPRLLLIFCSPTQASKMNDGGRGKLSNGSNSEVPDSHRLVFLFLFLRITVTLRYKVPRNGGVARVLNDWNLKGGGM